MKTFLLLFFSIICFGFSGTFMPQNSLSKADTLAVVRPFTVVEVIKEGKRTDNETLAGKIEAQITSITTKLLDDKFKLTPIYTLADTIKGEDLVPYLLTLDESPKKAKGSATPLFIQKALYATPSRYCMLTLYYGQSDLDMEAHLKDVAAVSGTVYINQGAHFRYQTKHVGSLRIRKKEYRSAGFECPKYFGYRYA